MLFVVKCEIVLFQTFLCQHGVQYGNIRRNIPGTVDKKAVQQFLCLLYTSSGCRILVTLLHAMQKRDVTYGLATLCIGGGMGCATIVKKEA